MKPPGWFKYATVISLVFFLLSSILLSTQAVGYSIVKDTISELIVFLNPNQRFIYSSIFFVKFIFDICFTYYIFDYFGKKLRFVHKLFWLSPILSYGILIIIPFDTIRPVHDFFSWAMFLSWPLAQHAIARQINNMEFRDFTNIVILFQYVTIILFGSFGLINAMAEITYVLISLAWITRFTLKELS